MEQSDKIAGVQGRLQQYESARKHLPEVADEQTKHDSRAQALIQRVGTECLLHGPAFMCVDANQRATIVEFSTKHFEVDIPGADVLSSAHKDSSGLKRRTEAASDEGKIEETASRARQRIARLREEAQAALETLALWQGTLEQAEALPVPLEETINRFGREFTEIDTAIGNARRDIRTCEDDRTRLAEKISVFLQAQPVPSEDQLVEDRSRRERGWELVRRDWLSREDITAESAAFDPNRSLDQAYELSVEKADETSDRLRREADRVAVLAELKTALARAEHRLEELKADLLRLQAQREEKDAEWTVQWRAAGIEEPLTHSEMHEWLQRHGKLVRLCGSIREEEAGLSQTELLIGSHRTQLLAELASLGQIEVPADTTLQDLIGLGRDIIEAVAVIKELLVEIEQSNDCLSRVHRMEKSISAFDSDVAQLIAETQMAELSCAEAAKAAREIQERFQQAANDQAGLDLLDRQYDAARLVQDTAETALSSLANEVGYEDLDTLESAVKDSESYYELHSRKMELDEKLGAYTSGASAEKLVEKLSEVEEDDLAGLIAGLAHDLRELDAKRDELSSQRGEKRKALSSLDRSDELAAEVQNAQSAIAEAKAAVERYVSLHLAAEILDMEIERYQKENQDPVLARASEIFPALTLSSFKGVATEHTTKGGQMIVGVRPTGPTVDVSGMSDGTRDQLYLALRIASLEQHIKNGVVLPLIVDDVLIEFDDDRACVALETLAQLSSKTQVLYFTHHRHIVDLAGRAVGAGRVNMHELTSSVAA